MSNNSNLQILVIGLAEATLDLIIPWAEAGYLPNFQRLMEEGVYGPLESKIPFITPQMWGTIYTGTSASQHGAFDFWQRGENGRFREINGSELKQKTIWDLLGEGGISSGIVNMPFTYPPRTINGYMIAGEDAPGAHRSIANPPELYDEVTRKFGRYRLKDIFPGGRNKSDYLTLIEEDVIRQTDVLEYLVKQHPTDLFFSFYSASAISQHYFWSDMKSCDKDNPYQSVIETAYRTLDASIGRLMQAVGPEAQVYVISECGAGPLQSGVNINAWLEQEGFLRYRTGSLGAGADQNTRINAQSAIADARKKVQGALQKGLPKSLYYLANRYLGLVKAWVQSYVTDAGIDWTQTRAFSRGKEGNIFINLQGRDPHGIVKREEYDDLCQALVNRLNALVDPATDKPAVERAYRSRELYAGSMQAIAPDVTIAWRDGLYCPHEGKRGDHSVFVPRWREYMNWHTTGGHRTNGILFAKGPGIRRGHQINGAGILDLMPTWLHSFGQEIPDHVEGTVISRLFESKE
jgi:predicted AlkP superfamily phosphohydrolase/phosphomutase